MDTGRIRSGLRAATARPIRSAIRRFEFERSGLDIYRALAGCRRKRPLPRGKPGDGVAARRLSRTDGKKFSRPRRGALAAIGRPSTGNALGAPALRVARHPCRMAASDPDRRKSVGHRVRYLPAPQPAPSTGARSDPTDAAGALVLRRGDRAWCRIDARADLSRALP